MNNTIDHNFKALIQNEANWPKFQELINAASRIVGEFDEGSDGILATNEDGMYDRSTNIEQLRGAILSIEPYDLVPHGDHFPHLTDEQVEKIRLGAISSLMAGDGNDHGMSKEDAEAEVSDFCVYELLHTMGWDGPGERISRILGFDPETGLSV